VGRRFWGRLAGAALLAVLAGCSSGNAVNTGPFGGVGGPGQECFPVHSGEVITDGFNAVQNHGHATAVIDKVSLASPHGLRLLIAYAVRFSGELYGVQAGYPPSPEAKGFPWATHQDADGIKVPPSTGHEVTNLLLVIQTSGKRATDSGINVYYSVGQQHYHLKTNTSLLALVAKRCF
jgi:hypothetical protein